MTKADIINKIVEDTGLAKQDVGTEDSPQHIKEHDHRHRGTRLPCIQAGQELYCKDEIINNFTNNI